MANSLLDFVMSLVSDPDAAAAYAADPTQAIADANLTDVTSVDVNHLIPVVAESLSTAVPSTGTDGLVDDPSGNVWTSGAATAAFDAFDDHVPAVVEAHPGLHLPSDLVRHDLAPEQRRGDRKVASVGRNAGARGRAHQADRRTRAAKRRDLVVAIEVLGSSVANDALARQKKRIQCRHIVGDQRALVVREGGVDLGRDLRIIDRHDPRFRLSIDRRSALRKGMSAN